MDLQLVREITKEVVSRLRKVGLSYFYSSIDNTPDHVAIQAFFYKVGRELGFKVGCEKDKWDVKWVTEREPIRIEVELGSQRDITKKLQYFFEGLAIFNILVVNTYLYIADGTDYFRTYLLDKSLNHENGFGPLPSPKQTGWLLVIDVFHKAYELLQIDPAGSKVVESGWLDKEMSNGTE